MGDFVVVVVFVVVAEFFLDVVVVVVVVIVAVAEVVSNELKLLINAVYVECFVRKCCLPQTDTNLNNC